MVQVHAIPISLEGTVTDQSYTTAFTVDRRPDEAFNAINNVRDWWEDTIAGPATRSATSSPTGSPASTTPGSG